MRQIAQKLTRIKQRFGAPFNVTGVEVVTDLDQWKQSPRSVALLEESDGEIAVWFAGDGITAARFVELAKIELAGFEFAAGEEGVSFYIIPQPKHPKSKAKTDATT